MAELVYRRILLRFRVKLIGTTGSNPVTSVLNFYFIIPMSLLSDKDYSMVIEAIQTQIRYQTDNGTDCEHTITDYYTLLNWIRLERSKRIAGECNGSIGVS